MEGKNRIINFTLPYPCDIFFRAHLIGIFMIIRNTATEHDSFQIQCFAKFLAIFIHTTSQTQTTVSRMNKHLNTIQDVSFRIMSIECFLTGNLCIRMVVLYLIVIKDDGKSTTYTALRKANAANVDDQEGGEAIKGEGEKPIYAIQPSILRHKDGRLQVLCRTRNAQIATSWSSDNGETWSKVTLLDVPNNNSGTDAVTMKDGRHVLIYNDFSTLPGTPKGPRTPLCVAVSDDGIHWKNVMTLEDSPISQYSYPSIIQGKDGKLHAVYTWRRQRVAYKELDLSKLK